MPRPIIMAKRLGAATNVGYDPWLALCVATIKRAIMDDDQTFFTNPMYETMFDYCDLAVPGFFPREAGLVLPKGMRE